MGKNNESTMMIKGFGIIHCAGCKKPVGYFPADTIVDKDDELEIYCRSCAQDLKVPDQ